MLSGSEGSDYQDLDAFDDAAAVLSSDDDHGWDSASDGEGSGEDAASRVRTSLSTHPKRWHSVALAFSSRGHPSRCYSTLLLALHCIF